MMPDHSTHSPITACESSQRAFAKRSGVANHRRAFFRTVCTPEERVLVVNRKEAVAAAEV